MGIVDETGDHSENQQPLLLDMNCLSAKIKALSPLIDLLPGIARNDAVFRAYWCYYASDYRRRSQVFRRRLENADLIKQIKVRNIDDKSASLLDVLAQIEDGSADHEPITTVYNEFLKCFYEKVKPRKRTIVPDLKALELQEGEVCTALKKARNPYDIQQLKDELDRIRQIRLVHHSPKMFHGTYQIQPLKNNDSSIVGIKKQNKSLDARNTDSTISSDFSRNNRTALIRFNHLPVEQSKRKPIFSRGQEEKDFSREVNGKKNTTRRNLSFQPSAVSQSEEHKHKTYNVHYKGDNLHQIKESSRKDNHITKDPETLSRQHVETFPSKYASKILMQKDDENKVKNLQENKRRNGNKIHTPKAEQMIPQKKKNIHKSNPHNPKEVTSNIKKKKLTDKIKKIKQIKTLKESNKAASCKRLKPSSSQYIPKRFKANEPMKQKEEQEKAVEDIAPAELSENASREPIDHKSNESFATKPEIVLNKEDYKKLVEVKENVPYHKGSEVDTTKSEIANESDKKKHNIQSRESNSSLTSTINKQPKYNPFKFKDKKSLQMQYFYQTKRSSLYKNIVPIHTFIEELTKAKSIKKHSDSDLVANLPIEALRNPEVTEALSSALAKQGLLNEVSLERLLRHSDPNYEGKSVASITQLLFKNDEEVRRSTIGSQSSYSPTDSIKYKTSSSKLNTYQDHATKLSMTSMSSDTSHGRGTSIVNAKVPKQMSKRLSQMVEEFIREPNMQSIFENLCAALIKSSTSTSDSEDSSRLERNCSICRQLQKHPSNLKPYMQQMESQRKKMELGNYYKQMMTRNCQQKREPDVRKSIERKWQHCSILKKFQNILPVHNHYDYWKSSSFY